MPDEVSTDFQVWFLLSSFWVLCRLWFLFRLPPAEAIYLCDSDSCWQTRHTDCERKFFPLSGLCLALGVAQAHLTCHLDLLSFYCEARTVSECLSFIWLLTHWQLGSRGPPDQMTRQLSVAVFLGSPLANGLFPYCSVGSRDRFIADQCQLGLVFGSTCNELDLAALSWVSPITWLSNNSAKCEWKKRWMRLMRTEDKFCRIC